MSLSGRGLLVLLCAVTAAAQTAGRPPAKKRSKAPLPAAPVFLLVDAAAEATDLTAADFAVSVNGEPRKVIGAWRLDAQTGSILPASTDIALKPDQIHRTLVLIADDLGMTAEQSHAVRQALTRFVEEQVLPADLVSVMHTAAGSGALEKLTGDRRELAQAIAAIQYNPGDGQREDYAQGARGEVRTAVAGLGDLVGRKAVVLFTGNRTLLERQATPGLVYAANVAGVTFSAIDVRGPGPSPVAAGAGLRLLAGETGGRFFSPAADLSAALAHAVEDQNAYYLVRYEGEAQATGLFAGNPQPHPVLTATRAGVELRARKNLVRAANFLAGAAQRDSWRPSFTTPAADLRHGLVDPFASGGIPIRFTASYINGGLSSSIESCLHIDAHDLTFTRRLDGRATAALDIEVASFDENGISAQSGSASYPVELSAEQYQAALQKGFTTTPTVPLRGSGGFQVRVSVRDGTSGRIGSASQFLSVPDASRGQLAITGITMSAKDNSSADAAMIHVLHPDQNFTVHYQVLNLTPDDSKHSRLEVLSSILRDGKAIYAGKPELVDFNGVNDPKRRGVNAEFRLGTLEPGLYALQISVRDLVSKDPRSASQYTFFEVK